MFALALSSMVSEAHLSVGCFASFKFRWMTDFITRLTRIYSHNSKVFRKAIQSAVCLPGVSRDLQKIPLRSNGDEEATQRHGLECNCDSSRASAETRKMATGLPMALRIEMTMFWK